MANARSRKRECRTSNSLRELGEIFHAFALKRRAFFHFFFDRRRAVPNIMMPWKDDGICGEFFYPLDRFEHLIVAAGFQVRASAIADENRVAREQVGPIGFEKVAAFARAMTGRMQNRNRDIAQRDFLPVRERLRFGAINFFEPSRVSLMNVERKGREAFQKFGYSCDMVPMRVRQQNTFQFETVFVESFKRGIDIELRIHPRGFASIPVQNQVDEIFGCPEFELRDRLSGNEPFGFGDSEVLGKHFPPFCTKMRENYMAFLFC